MPAWRRQSPDFSDRCEKSGSANLHKPAALGGVNSDGRHSVPQTPKILLANPIVHLKPTKRRRVLVQRSEDRPLGARSWTSGCTRGGSASWRFGVAARTQRALRKMGRRVPLGAQSPRYPHPQLWQEKSNAAATLRRSEERPRLQSRARTRKDGPTCAGRVQQAHPEKPPENMKAGRLLRLTRDRGSIGVALSMGTSVSAVCRDPWLGD
jgi:hypothetical protein